MFSRYHVSRGTCQIELFFFRNVLFAATDAWGSFKISAYFLGAIVVQSDCHSLREEGPAFETFPPEMLGISAMMWLFIGTQCSTLERKSHTELLVWGNPACCLVSSTFWVTPEATATFCDGCAHFTRAKRGDPLTGRRTSGSQEIHLRCLVQQLRQQWSSIDQLSNW